MRGLRLAVVGNYPPRLCGIATFTRDFCSSVAESPGAHCFAVAVNETGSRYGYPSEVRFEIAEADPESYRAAADFLNRAPIDAVSLQHEFGIFGGDAGAHVIELASGLRVPLITTLHTILSNPDDAQRRVIDALVEHSAKIVVMTEKGRSILNGTHPAATSKTVVIPHGIPAMRIDRPADAKAHLGLADRPMLLTFGLISPNKGLETMIEALPAIVANHPTVNYVILGATHPHLVQREGESYRDYLTALAAERGVAGNIEFLNRYATLAELCEYLAASDLYVTPYRNEAQVVSGTLAYSFGLGKPVVSTPYWHAAELLADGRGELVPFQDAGALASAITGLLSDDDRRAAIAERAYKAGRRMTWPNVAQSYLDVVRSLDHQDARARNVTRLADRMQRRRRRASLAHLQLMSDDTGLYQHARFSLPNRDHGYCIDDNARALLLMAERHRERALAPREVALLFRYAGFVDHAWNPDTSRFRNHMSYGRQWLDEAGTDDSNGRTLWALGVAAEAELPRGLSDWAAVLFEQAVGTASEFTSPRAWAFAMIALDRFPNRQFNGLDLDTLTAGLCRKMRQRFADAARADWVWFEDVLGYDNARLSEACIRMGDRRGDKALFEIGIRSLEWLTALQTSPEGHFRPVGTDSFGIAHQMPKPFDQQPVEVAAHMDACIAAYRAVGQRIWLERAGTAFSWFEGRNDLSVPAANAETGASYDGLHADRVNANQGAESCLAYLLADHAMRNAQTEGAREVGLLRVRDLA